MKILLFTFLHSLAAGFGCAAEGAQPARESSHDQVWTAISAGRSFLSGLRDAELGLLPEFAGHPVFWLFHDNYLAAKVLDSTQPDEAAAIRQTITRHGVTKSGKIELLFGEAELPLHRYELRDVATVGKKVIRSEFTMEALTGGVEHYADLLFFTAIAEKDAARGRAAHEAAMAMWDGTGFRDAVVELASRYATYKLGLALISMQKYGDTAGSRSALVSRLLSLQGSSGGWITDYRADGKAVGQANVETTSLAILGLEAAGLPLQKDLRPKFALLGLKQRIQGRRDTCSVFTVVEAAEFATAQSEGRGLPLSVEFANWAANECTGRRDEGDFFHNILRGMEAYGVCSAEAMEYAPVFSAELAPSAAAKQQAAEFKGNYRLSVHWLKGWEKKPGLGEEDVRRIKTVLACGYPVCAGSYHSVLFVGYADDPAVPGGGKFFIADSNGREMEITYLAARERFCDLLWISAVWTRASGK